MDFLQAVSFAKKGFKVRREAWKKDEWMTSVDQEKYLVHNQPFTAEQYPEKILLGNEEIFKYVAVVNDIYGNDWIAVPSSTDAL